MSRHQRWYGALVCLLLVGSGATAATLRVPSEYVTINAGLDAAAVGDTVLVAPGTYDQYETRLLGDGNWFSAVAFLRGGVSLVSEAGPMATLLRMDSAATTPTITHGFGETGSVEISGFTMTGVAPGIAAVSFTYGGRLVLRDCVFRDIGTGPADGGAVGSVLSDLEVYGCHFENVNSSVGGGIIQRSGTVLVEDSEFLNCRSGAIEVSYDPHRPHATGLTVRRCRFVGNVKTNGGGGGVNAGNYGQLLIEDCWFEGNSGIGGGALDLGGVSTTVRNCSFVRNSGGMGYGGAAYLWAGTVVLMGNTFFGNSVALPYLTGGSAVVLQGASPKTFRRNVVVNSTGDQAVHIDATTLDEGCNVFWGNPQGNSSGFTPSATDLEADPLFCDPAANDFHVGVGSPCVPGSGYPSCTALIGAWGEGCGTVAIPPTTWGKVKSEFRTEVRP